MISNTIVVDEKIVRDPPLPSPTLPERIYVSLTQNGQYVFGKYYYGFICSYGTAPLYLGILDAGTWRESVLTQYQVYAFCSAPNIVRLYQYGTGYGKAICLLYPVKCAYHEISTILLGAGEYYQPSMPGFGVTMAHLTGNKYLRYDEDFDQDGYFDTPGIIDYMFTLFHYPNTVRFVNTYSSALNLTRLTLADISRKEL